ncbi:inovirus Gp2 family protein [Amphritea sp.]|uniref:inovirus Gp2 family protein n=1 Tax=Amphritea sp. TaxID=1872502 RepID=UPI003A935EAB
MCKLINNHGPLNMRYLDKIKTTIDKAICQYPRTIAIRVDLRLPALEKDSKVHSSNDSPSYFADTDSKVISRFFSSLDAQIDADLMRRNIKDEKTLRYAWAKEQSKEHRDHYHVLILLNKDHYAYLGRYNSIGANLANRISRAWTNALRVDFETFKHLVHFPENPLYRLNRNELGWEYGQVFEDLIFRASYLAKKETKQYGDGFRSFGCSRR